MALWLSWLILTGSIILASYLLDNIRVADFLTAFIAAAVLGIFNAFLRPLILILTLPLNILTLGLFTFIVNAMMLKLASFIIPGFEVEGFWAAFIGAMIITLVNWLIHLFMSDKKVKVDIIDLKRKGRNRWE